MSAAVAFENASPEVAQLTAVLANAMFAVAGGQPCERVSEAAVRALAVLLMSCTVPQHEGAMLLSSASALKQIGLISAARAGLCAPPGTVLQ